MGQLELGRREVVMAGAGGLLLACSGEPELNEPGAKAPAFSLEDFQPLSPRFGEAYGAEEFRGSVLLLPLFAGWCQKCVACAYFLNDLYKEWQASGLNVRVMSINSVDGLTFQDDLIEVCDFPLLQDTEAVGIWQALRGSKDDHYVYSADGVLDGFFDYESGVAFDALTPQGKANLLAAIVAAGA